MAASFRATRLPPAEEFRVSNTLLEHAIAAERAAGRVVVVLVHWGDKYLGRVNDAQRRWARRLADGGATVIAGAGPHVVQQTGRGAIVGFGA